MKIVVGSMNPVKIEAVREGFASIFKQKLDVVGVDVHSEVSAQPKSDQEIFTGARNRARNARAQKPDADFWVGVESGIELLCGESVHDFSYVVVIDKAHESFGRSVSFPLSRLMHAEVLKGADLTQVMFNRFGVVNAGAQNGSIGYLTRDAITRKHQTVPAVITALIPFLNPAEYFRAG